MLRNRRRLVGPLGVLAGLAIVFPLGVLAAISFADVPPGHPFYYDIQEVANAGVTTGCGGGNYCPDQNVTRGQMAAFMNRLGALGADKTPVVNADKLDGHHASDYYTKAELDSLPGAHVVAAGAVGPDGSAIPFMASLGSWNSSSGSTGIYVVTITGADPTCTAFPLITLSSLFTASTLTVTDLMGSCGPGGTTAITIEARSSAGTLQAASLMFTAYSQAAASPTSAAATSSRSRLPSTVVRCAPGPTGEGVCR